MRRSQRRVSGFPTAPSSAANGLGKQGRTSTTSQPCSPDDGGDTVALDPAIFRGKVAVFARERFSPAAPGGGGGARQGITGPRPVATLCPTSSAPRQRSRSKSRSALTKALPAAADEVAGVAVAAAQAVEIATIARRRQARLPFFSSASMQCRRPR